MARSSSSCCARSPPSSKIYVAGAEEVALTKINEVLDIKKDQILDLAKLKKNVEKIKELYVEKGFYMAEVTYELRRNSPAEVDVWFRVRENAKVEVRRVNFVGNHAVTRRRAARRHRHARGEPAVDRHLGRHLPRGRLPARPPPHPGPLLGPRLRPGQGRRTRSSSCRPTSSRCTSRSRSTRGPQYTLGKVDVTGDLLESKEFFLEARLGQAGRDLQPLEAVRRSAEAHRLLQGPGLRLRQRHARDARQREDAHRRRHLRDPEGRARLPSTASTSAATRRRATRSSGASCASSRAIPTTSRCSTTRSGASRRSASSRRSTSRPSAAHLVRRASPVIIGSHEMQLPVATGRIWRVVYGHRAESSRSEALAVVGLARATRPGAVASERLVARHRAAIAGAARRRLSGPGSQTPGRLGP